MDLDPNESHLRRHDHGGRRSGAGGGIHQPPGADSRREDRVGVRQEMLRPSPSHDARLQAVHPSRKPSARCRWCGGSWPTSRSSTRAWRAAVARFELLTGGARADWGETQELVAAREDVTRHADRINQYLQELEAIGCVFKGFEAGLVDFYSLREDSPDLPLLAPGRGSDHPLARDRYRLRRPPADRRRHPLRRLLVIRLWLFLHLLGFTLWLGGGDRRHDHGHRRQARGPARPGRGGAGPGVRS